MDQAMMRQVDGAEPESTGCGSCACPYCDNLGVDSDTRHCCGEVHAFICGEFGVLCYECEDAGGRTAEEG